ncbi:MAG: HigA family addiction module antitoxin [Bacteroidia bacterium]
MSKNSRIINEGGINGTNQGVVNINSKDYKALQKAIQAQAKEQSKEDKINYKLISLRLQMETYISEKSHEQIKTVGYFLREFINSLNIRNKDFANFIEIEESNLSSILNDKRKIHTELAFILGMVFNVDPNIWLMIQNKNDLLGIEGVKDDRFKRFKLENLLKKVG